MIKFLRVFIGLLILFGACGASFYWTLLGPWHVINLVDVPIYSFWGIMIHVIHYAFMVAFFAVVIDLITPLLKFMEGESL
jgi:hypothetical protein